MKNNRINKKKIKMEKITLEELKMYLDTDLQIANVSLKGEILNTYTIEINNNNDRGIENVLFGVNQFPLLRPLSDLTKEIEVDGEKFVPSEILEILEYGQITNFYKANIGGLTPRGFTYYIVEKLFKWHFDVFSLIEKGKAININTINLK